jgi:predicted RNA-binding protein YlqC (UPF0109 family)
MGNSIDQQFVEFVVKSLVNHPDAVQVERRIDEKGVLLELTVDPEDLGRVIGNRGGTAQSMRTLLRALCTKNDSSYNLKIIDNGPDPRLPREEAQPAEAPAEASAAPADRKPDLDLNDLDDEPVAKTESSDDLVSKTRRELEDLDDLDV